MQPTPHLDGAQVHGLLHLLRIVGEGLEVHGLPKLSGALQAQHLRQGGEEAGARELQGK